MGRRLRLRSPGLGETWVTRHESMGARSNEKSRLQKPAFFVFSPRKVKLGSLFSPGGMPLPDPGHP